MSHTHPPAHLHTRTFAHYTHTNTHTHTRICVRTHTRTHTHTHTHKHTCTCTHAHSHCWYLWPLSQLTRRLYCSCSGPHHIHPPPPPPPQPSPLFLLCVCAPPQDTPPCRTHRKHKTIAIGSICKTSQACVSHVTDQSVCPTANKHRTQNSLCRGRRLHPPGAMNTPCAQGALIHTGCQPYMTPHVHVHTQKHIRTHVLTCTHVCTLSPTHTSEQHCSLVLLAPDFTTTAKIHVYTAFT